MKMKLLSPAGDFESLKATIYNGADEVYLGIAGFNARNNITGFTLDTLKEAVDFAHIYNVRVFLAINILFSDSELNDTLKTIIDAYNMGVDAFIIQDLGLAELLHSNYPEIELHASTQMGICNLEGAKYISKFGFKRIVLARETSIEEIKRIKKNLDIEIEYFVQGALCVSFSGNCYLSSYLCDASGNRGKCKQLCRLPYSLFHNNKKIKEGYLLSAKDFNMLHNLNELQAAGVDSLKIEGRARRPFYVAAATKTYRAALDNLPYTEDILNLAFSRDFTPGYINGNHNIISKYKSHIGINVGQILQVKYGRRFNEITFSSNMDISPKSTLKIFQDDKEICTFTAYSINKKGNLYSTTTTQDIPKKGNIHLILDESLEKSILAKIYKKPITIEIIAEINKNIFAKISTETTTISVTGDVCEKAKNQPITKEEIYKNFSKTDIFDPTIKINLDEIFLSKQQLNSFRRNCYDEILKALKINSRTPLTYKKIKINKSINPLQDFDITILNDSIPNANTIIYSPETYTLSDIEQFIKNCKKAGRVPMLDTPNFLLKEDIEFFDKIANKTNVGFVANNYALLDKEYTKIAGAALNIYNNVSAAVINKPFLTAEQALGSKINFAYMTLRHCPMKEHINCDCSNCKYDNNFKYKMQNGTELHLRRKKMSTCTFYLTNKN